MMREEERRGGERRAGEKEKEEERRRKGKDEEDDNRRGIKKLYPIYIPLSSFYLQYLSYLCTHFWIHALKFSESQMR